jgi:SRSO17 transposase
MTNFTLDTAGERRLEGYLDRIGDVLGDAQRRASFATYAFGLLSEGERKSMEPIAARASGGPARASAAHQRLHHFIANASWSDRAVRRVATEYALRALVSREPVVAWLIDDTGFLKQGTKSVGVQRQYTGSAGKTTNCQIGVSLSLTTPTQQLPVEFELYLPECWTEDASRRKGAHIPDDVAFRTKPELSLLMMDRALADGLPQGVVLADSAYGNSSQWRLGLRERGLDYAVGIDSTTKVWKMDRLLRRQGQALSVAELAEHLGAKAFRRVTWRQGTRQALSARFAFARVVPYHDDGTDPSDREDVWLIVEWEDSESEPTKFHFATLPRNVTKMQLIRTLKLRWRTERVYEDLKGELGLDHFEGRSFRGWHHHISAVLACNAFVVAELASAFPPSA